jgi:uncharacterized protein (UPF0276 family)
MVALAYQLCPVAVHFTLHAGRGKLEKADWNLIEQLLAKTGTPYINLHLDPQTEHFPGIPVDTETPAHWQEVAERMIADTSFVVERYGAERVIVENVPYRGQQGTILRPATEPQIIRLLVKETGCGFLLDIPHARIAAYHLGIDERQYLASLPTDQIRELHFTGLHRVDGRLQDHLAALDADWLLLGWVLERIHAGDWGKPWLLAFEYGGVGPIFNWRSDPQVIQNQVPRLYEMAHNGHR